MTSRTATFTRDDLLRGFRAIGLNPGDIVFVHVGLDGLGKFAGCATEEQGWQNLLEVLKEALGPDGTILVPTYTFSFCRREAFDVQNTPTAGGPWSPSGGFLEYFRRLPGVRRSADPIHSVAGLGPRSSELLSNLPSTCFGEDSTFDRLRRMGGKICLIGLGLHEGTFLHHVEEMAKVPFRFKKLFTGYIRDNGKERKTGWIYNVRILAPNSEPDEHRFQSLAIEAGVLRSAQVGGGRILGIDAETHYDFTIRHLKKDAWCTAMGPTGDPLELENKRLGVDMLKVALPANASLEEMMTALWRLPRDIVSDGYDAALNALASQVPMQIHQYPTGSECWSWLVPEKWTCHEAYLETLEGRRLFSYADNPLHVVSYSLPFEGIVSRKELQEHLHVHDKIPEAIPFVFKYYERDWGLCCSKRLRDGLRDERYKVVVRSDFSFGTLKVGEVVAKGQSDDCIVLCAHLCHPAMVNDDLSGVLVGVSVMKALLSRRNLRYTYRFLVVPETIGSVCYLSQNGAMIPRMKGGLFLEMLGLQNPHALQLSLDGKTEMDLCMRLALKAGDPYSWTGAYRTVVGNDERQFNGPGVQVPMLSLSRVLPSSVADSPYREYHSSHDSPETASVEKMRESAKLVLRMIDTIEANRVPINRFKGEVFCSRFGLFIDPYENPEGNRALFDIMDIIDGNHSVAQIANKCGVSFESVRSTIDELELRGLVDYGTR